MHLPTAEEFRVWAEAAQRMFEGFLPLAAIIDRHRRATDTGATASGVLRQIGVATGAAMLVGVVSGGLSSFVMLRVLATDITALKTTITQVREDMTEQRGRLDRHIDKEIRR